MFQVPLWTSIKALEYPIWSLRALSPPVRCCLSAPCLLSLCGLFLCPCVVLPPPLCPLSSRADVPVFPGCVRCFSVPLSLVSFLRFVTLFRCSGLLPLCWIRSLFALLVTLVLGVFTSSPRSAFTFAFLALVVFWFLVVCCWAPLSVLFFVGFWGEVGLAPEPWTGLHCSELHWRWPVELPALLSRAPASSKACTHGSFSTDAAVLRVWHVDMSA